MGDTHVLQNTQTVINELKDNQCCNNCILRFIGELSSSSQVNADETVAKLLGEDSKTEASDVKLKKANPCSTCLGLLQEPFLQDQVNKIVREVSDAGYDCDDVAFALSLPVALLIRNHSLWIHLYSKFTSYYLDKNCDYTSDPTSEESFSYSKFVVSLKDAWRTLVAQNVANQVKKTLNNGVEGQFIVNVNFEYPANEEEAACMADMHPDIFGGRENQKRKYHNEIFTRKSVEMALSRTNRDLFTAHCEVPPSVATHFLSCTTVVCCHEPLYIAGRYNKFSRSLSQTPWVINGERRMKSSVEEIIREPVAKKIRHDVIKFASSGREDVDVRTLGKGRPFVLDVQNPRTTKLTFQELRSLEAEINQSTEQVFVRDLQIVDKKDLVHIKAGEQTKTKTYYCYCTIRWSSHLGDIEEVKKKLETKLDSLKNENAFVIKQLTPIRVLHRRPLATRERTVHWINGEYAKADGENLFFKLQVKVEAGTYIKELVHGDLGRTIPNLSQMLGYEADILALDVEEVDLPWPPSVTNGG